MTDTKPEGPYFPHKRKKFNDYGIGGPGRNPEEWVAYNERWAVMEAALLNEGYKAGRASRDRLREALIPFTQMRTDAKGFVHDFTMEATGAYEALAEDEKNG